MPSVKNASYQVLEVLIIFRCSECRTKIPSHVTDETWDKSQIWKAGQFHEMSCPNCQVLNKFPSRLINCLNG